MCRHWGHGRPRQLKQLVLNVCQHDCHIDTYEDDGTPASNEINAVLHRRLWCGTLTDQIVTNKISKVKFQSHPHVSYLRLNVGFYCPNIVKALCWLSGWTRWSVWRTLEVPHTNTVSKHPLSNFNKGHLLRWSDPASPSPQHKEAKSDSSNCCWFTGACLVLPGLLYCMSSCIHHRSSQ